MAKTATSEGSWCTLPGKSGNYRSSFYSRKRSKDTRHYESSIYIGQSQIRSSWGQQGWDVLRSGQKDQDATEFRRSELDWRLGYNGSSRNLLFIWASDSSSSNLLGDPRSLCPGMRLRREGDATISPSPEFFLGVRTRSFLCVHIT